MSERALDVAPAWRAWVAENLLRDEPAADVVLGLIESGVPESLAHQVVEETLRSPIFRAASPFARESRRLRTLARLDRARWNAKADPTGIERIPYPGNEVFFERYWAAGAPVVFAGMTEGWKAHQSWQLAALAERFGDVPVDITDGRASNPNYDMEHKKHIRTVLLREYIERIRATEGESNDFYMVANNRNTQKGLAGVFDDIALPPRLFRDDLAAGSAFWLGPAGTVTPLHHDTSNILFFQLIGRKRYRMIAPLELAVLDGAQAMYAGVDPEKPDLERYPWWSKITVRDFVLEPGDALFIPVGWWHHVRALDVSVSLALNAFRQENQYDWYVPARD